MNHAVKMDGMNMNDAKKQADTKTKADMNVANPEKTTNNRRPIEHQNSGQSKWLPANDDRAVTNAGDKPAKFITLEFP